MDVIIYVYLRNTFNQLEGLARQRRKGRWRFGEVVTVLPMGNRSFDTPNKHPTAAKLFVRGAPDIETIKKAFDELMTEEISFPDHPDGPMAVLQKLAMRKRFLLISELPGDVQAALRSERKARLSWAELTSAVRTRNGTDPNRFV